MDIRKHKNAHVYAQIFKLKNKAHQISIIAPLIMNEETWVACPVCEVPFNLPNEDYRVDLYYPQLKWAIEVDEKQHLTPKQIAADKIRDKALEEVGITTTRVVISNENFIHVDEINKLKLTLLSKVKEISAYEEWNPKIFDVDKTLEDHNDLIFIYKKEEDNSFPPFRLASKFHNEKLKVVVLKESDSFFADSNLKMIDGVYDFTYLGQHSGQNGYISWSGMLITHCVVNSGGTITNMTGGAKHILK